MKNPGPIVKFERLSPAPTLPVVNPATGEKMCEMHVAGRAEVNAAVKAAQEAFPAWAALTGTERGRILRRASDLLRERNDELARLEVLDTGKPIQEALEVDIHSGADCLEYFGGVAAQVHGEHHQLGGNFAYTRREPLGVVAAIGAWNYPLQIACWKMAPALAAGNTVVYKPSEYTALTTMKLLDVFREAGLPPGVVNVVTGAGETGQLLCEHPGIDKISLTGSVPTGRAILRAAAERILPVTLELGGKSPLLIFKDADVEQAVSAAMLANFYTQGEVCSNGTRVLVHNSLKDAFEARLVERTKKLVVGDPLDPKTQVGALISAEHRDRVMGFIERAQAKLLVGGKALQGNFVEPTVFTDCDLASELWNEEVFGPVMAVRGFDSEQEALRLANDTPYGLAAGVFTRDLARAHRVVAGLEAGTCWINTYNITPIEMPFGGAKQSGLGRENSLHALDAYTQVKSVYVETGDVPCPYA